MDAAKRPIVNAIIMIDGEKTNALTNSDGEYKIKVSPLASKIGIFTFNHGTAEEAINGRTQIDFNFGTTGKQQMSDQEIAPGDQGINTGYGMVKKKNLTTDVNKIDGTNKKYASYTSLGEMISREVSGVRIVGETAVLQGSMDLQGDVTALIVVDGVQMETIPDIPPTSVKSIEVLKGTSAAIYGSKGYGGVIVIKTKTQN